MAERTPTAENSSFASTVNALQRASHATVGGTVADGQTIDNSCAVRVTDTRGSDKKLNHAGIAVSGGSRTIDNSPSSSLRTRSSSRSKALPRGSGGRWSWLRRCARGIANRIGVSWSPHLLHHGQPLVDWRQRRKRSMWFCLVPIGNRVVIVGTMIGVSVLDGGLERPPEGDGSIKMKTVDARSAPCQFRAHHRRPIKLIREGLSSEIPRAQEVILRTGA
jgi:hypothetical protein